MGRDLPGGVMTLRDGYLTISWDPLFHRVFRRIQTAMRQVARELDAGFTGSEQLVSGWSRCTSRRDTNGV